MTSYYSEMHKLVQQYNKWYKSRDVNSVRYHVKKIITSKKRELSYRYFWKKINTRLETSASVISEKFKKTVFMWTITNHFLQKYEWSRYNKVNLDSIVLQWFWKLMNYFSKKTLALHSIFFFKKNKAKYSRIKSRFF